MFKGLNNQLCSCNGRDQILRLIEYSAQLISSFSKNKKLSHLSELISECRTTLRLFDDIPMLSYSLSHGLGKNEPDKYMQVCGVIGNVLDQMYYPLEHAAWAADKGFISQQSCHWWTASNACWAFSLYFNLARSLRYLSILNDHAKHLDLSDPDMREEFKKNQRQQMIELLTGIRSVCDLAMAIHWMPEGFLWGGMLKNWHLGALGTVSSILSLLQSITFRQL